MTATAVSVSRMDGLAWLFLVVLAALWGSTFVFVEVMLTALPVLTLVALRVVIAAATLWAVALAIGAAPPPRRDAWAAFAVMGVCNNALPFSLIVWGQTAITAGLASVLVAVTPLFAALLAGVFLGDEALTRRKLVGILFGLAGVAVMIGPDALGAAANSVWGQAAVLGAALSYAFSAVFARRFKRMGLRPVSIAVGQTTTSSLILAPAALLIDHPFSLPMPSLGIWIVTVTNAILATGFAYIFYFALIARAGATNTALVTVLVPVVAVLVGIAVLGESVTSGQLAGMALIFAGLAVTDGRLLRRLP